MRNAELNLAQSALNAMLNHAPDELMEMFREWAEMALINDFGAKTDIESIRQYHALSDQVSEMFLDGVRVTVEFADGGKVQSVDQKWISNMIGDERPRALPTDGK